MAFYDKFEELCKTKGITPTRAARENGLAQSVISMWKTRGSTPQAATVQKLADYFGVTVDYLLGWDETKRQIEKLGQQVQEVAAPAQKAADQIMEFIRPMQEAAKADPDKWGSIDAVAKKELLEYFEELNTEGKITAAQRVSELTKIPDYQKPKTPK